MADQDPFSSVAEPHSGSDDPFSSIAEPIKVPPPTTGATLQVDTRGPATRWLQDLSADLRSGGGRTVVGRSLGTLQGRGNKGYSGLESGVSKGAAEFLGSPELGAVKTAQGIVETPEHPIKGPLKALGGVAEMATIPSMVMGGPGATAAIEAAPSRKFAAELFKDVSENAGNVPVLLQRSGPELTRFKELADAGGAMPKAVRRLMSRAAEAGTPGGKPLTYDEARDIYSNLSSLSAEDASRLNPVMRRQMGKAVQALKDDIGEAAGQTGQAAKYYAALKNYAQASKLLRASGKIQEYLAKPAIKAAGAGAGGVAGYELYKKVK